MKEKIARILRPLSIVTRHLYNFGEKLEKFIKYIRRVTKDTLLSGGALWKVLAPNKWRFLFVLLATYPCTCIYAERILTGAELIKVVQTLGVKFLLYPVICYLVSALLQTILLNLLDFLTVPLNLIYKIFFRHVFLINFNIWCNKVIVEAEANRGILPKGYTPEDSRQAAIDEYKATSRNYNPTGSIRWDTSDNIKATK